jgi:hypothetical protein
MNADKLKKARQIITHEYDSKYDASFVYNNIEIPKNQVEIPRIVGWSGPARSGTTALLYLLAGHPEVDRVYFQPQTTLLRFGRPKLKLSSVDTLVCMKEVFFSSEELELLDPIETLLKAGVPPEKITWIAMLRDPLQTFGSCEKYGDDILKQDPEVFAAWQRHTIHLWEKYKDTNIQIIPFAYDLLKGREEHVLKQLSYCLGINPQSVSLKFDEDAIRKKLVPGQAADENYFRLNLKDTINKGLYEYTTNSYPVGYDDAQRVIALCQKDYESFLELARRTLSL